MKKIALLTLALVLALSTVAFAETSLTTSGYVKYGFDKVGDVDPAYWYGLRVNFAGTVNENSGFQIRFQSGDKDPIAFTVNTTTGAGSIPYPADSANWTLKRYNFWTKLAGVGKFVVGGQFEDLGGLNIWYADGDLMGATGRIGFYPETPENVKIYGFYHPVDKVIGAQGKYTADAFTVWGGAQKADAADDMAFAVGGSYTVIPDLSVYAQYQAVGDVDEQFVGGKYTVAGIDSVVEYMVDAKTLGLDFTKEFQGVEYNLNYKKPDAGDATISVGATLNF